MNCATTTKRILVFVTLAVAGQMGVESQTPPSITKQPLGGSRSLGDFHTFKPTFRGDPPLTYQWEVNGVKVVNGTNAVFTVGPLTAKDSGSYRVTVSNSAGSVISESVGLDIDPAFTVVSESPVARDSGQGMSWVDFDADGWLDLYCAGETQHLLYRNLGGREFQRHRVPSSLTAASHPSQELMGGFWADYDNDGLPDLYAVHGGTLTERNNQLFRNLGQGSFVRVTEGPQVRTTSKSVMALWGDFDSNGALDLFVINSAFDNSDAGVNFLFLGDGRGGFTRSRNGVGLEQRRAFNGGAAADFDGDGDLDVVTTAWGTPGNVFTVENLQGTEFEHFPIGSFGSFVKSCSWADYDNDGDLDLFVGYEFEPARLFQNMGDGFFEEAVESGLSLDSQHAFTGAWADYDNDGWLDLLVTTYRGPWDSSRTKGDNVDARDYLYRNNGDRTFTRIFTGSVVNDDADSITAAWGDYDNDGFLDLAVGRSSWWPFATVAGNKSVLFHNNGNSNSWLMLQLVGTKSNRSAIGAKVFLTTVVHGRRMTQMRELNAGHGWASQSDLRPHFGLGDAKQAERVRIEWPSGQVTELTHVSARQILKVIEPGGAPSLKGGQVMGRVEITLTGDSGKSYLIEVSTDLVHWSELMTLTVASEPVSFFDANSRGMVSRFYRAVGR